MQKISDACSSAERLFADDRVKDFVFVKYY